MTPTIIDQDGRSTIASAEAQAALAAGDTQRARDKHAEAAELLERDLARAQDDGDKHLILFLAATQYYKGGHYQEALALARRVRARFLPDGVARLLPEFLRNAEDRASPDYEARVRERFLALWASRDHAAVLELLQEHPYVLPPGGLAFLRAVACESLGKYRPAALFYADAVRRSPEDPGLVCAAAVFPVNLAHEGRLQEAWEYVSHLLEMIPHAATYLVASLLCFHRAEAAEALDARNKLLEQQAGYLEQARAAFANLPASQQSSAEIRPLVALGLEAGAFGLFKVGDHRRAREMGEAAVAFEPEAADPLIVRGITTYPGPAAVADFKKAVDLGAETYYPYLYLAHDALERGDFATARHWSQEALRRGERQDPAVQSALYGWLAICQANLGGEPDEIKGLFGKALEIDPANEAARENYRLYQDSSRPGPAAWSLGRVRGDGSLFLRGRESGLVESFRVNQRLQHTILAATNAAGEG